MPFPKRFLPPAYIALTLLLAACNQSTPQKEQTTSEPQTAPTSKPLQRHKLLSEFSFFTDLPKQIPAEGVLPYELNSAHFADHARVHRFIYLPQDSPIHYRENGVLDFPVGTVLIQTFGYPADKRDPDSIERLIETRLLVHEEQGWHVAPYKWNEEMTDAKRAVAGGLIDVEWIQNSGEKRTLKYQIPNSNECKRCHENNQEAVLPLGLTARNLNRNSAHTQTQENQLSHWSALGLLEDLPSAPEKIDRLPQWDHPETGGVTARARAWLHVNCSHCHNPNGKGSVSGLDLSLHQDNPVRFGIFKPPVSAGRASEGLQFSIEPGNPDQSFIIRRLTSTDPSIMMPPVGRRSTSEAAVKVIREWIAAMTYDPQETQRIKTKQIEALDHLNREGVWKEETSP